MARKKNDVLGKLFGLSLFGIVVFAIIVFAIMIGNRKDIKLFNIFTPNSGKEGEKISIKFDKDEYSCEQGDSFETIITTNASTINNVLKSYNTKDNSIATIDDNTQTMVKCMNCKTIRVVCHKPGKTKMLVESTNGVVNTAELTVKPTTETIAYDKFSYSCEAGETFETKITVNGLGTIKSYSTSDSSVATIDTQTSSILKCYNCKLVRVVCKKGGEVKLYAESSKGAKTEASLKVNEDKETISYEKGSYSCYAGEIFETKITVNGHGTIKSYSTSNSEVATVDDKTSGVLKCINCKLVRVVCKSAGTVKLKAESSGGAKTESNLSVSKPNETISYEKSNYSCQTGEIFETKITVNGLGTVKSYASSNTNVATVDNKTSSVLKCSNCMLVRVVCKSAGTVKLSAESSNGAKTESGLTVTKTNETISYEKASYSCTAGETFETKITVNGLGTIKSYSSSNTNVATVDNQTTGVLKCYNCKLVRVVCKKAGTVQLKATSSGGATTTSSLTVNNSLDHIEYEMSSYSCQPGETFETKITYSGVLKSYSTSNTAIATVDNQTSGTLKCPNCKLVRVVCKREGSVKLRASTNGGAVTESDLTVFIDEGTISYDQESYNCRVGETIDTTITANGIYSNGNYLMSTVSNYSSGNTSIATVAKHPTNTLKCPNCVLVQISCKKVGKTELRATSSRGATTSVSINVTAN